MARINLKETRPAAAADDINEQTANSNEELGMKSLMVLATAMAFGLSSGAMAQEADIDAGKAYAQKVCAACHAVLANQEISPLPQAPTFQSVADTRGMTEMALGVWLQSSHPTMPNIVLSQDEIRNVVAYIHSLKRKG
jgi:mono/diheme cytochrome c family protein